MEKQSLRQKIIAMLRKEGIAEDLINPVTDRCEVSKVLHNLRNAEKILMRQWMPVKS